jgi:hypothetical protein
MGRGIWSLRLPIFGLAVRLHSSPSKSVTKMAIYSSITRSLFRSQLCPMYGHGTRYSCKGSVSFSGIQYGSTIKLDSSKTVQLKYRYRILSSEWRFTPRKKRWVLVKTTWQNKTIPSFQNADRPKDMHLAVRKIVRSINKRVGC